MTCTADHPYPPDLVKILPPLSSMTDLAQAIAAAHANCRYCMVRYRDLAADLGVPVAQAVTVFLMFTAVLLNVLGDEPGDTGEEMVRKVAPDTLELLSPPTLALLTRLPVETTTDTPDGSKAGIWDGNRLTNMVDELPERDRKAAWNEALGLLVGIVQGEGRARQEARR